MITVEEKPQLESYSIGALLPMAFLIGSHYMNVRGGAESLKGSHQSYP
jgi:hypothetical protein